jgi:hypothetical protein
LLRGACPERSRGARKDVEGARHCERSEAIQKLGNEHTMKFTSLVGTKQSREKNKCAKLHHAQYNYPCKNRITNVTGAIIKYKSPER